MSKQFSILLTDLDLQALEKTLLEPGDAVLLSGTATDDDRSLHPLSTLAIPLPQAGKVPLFCYLAPIGMPKSIFLKRLSPVKISVDGDRSHLIEVMRPFYDGEIVRRGRLYYHNTLFIGDAFVPKDPDFCRWADRVFTRVKRDLKYDREQQAYVGNDAAQRLVDGTLTAP